MVILAFDISHYSAALPACVLDGVTRETHAITDNLNPVWNEEFEWVVYDGKTSNFAVYVRDTGMVDSTDLGHVQVDISTLGWNMPQAMDLPLVDGEGRVRLEMTYQPFLPTPQVDLPPPLPGRSCGALFVKLKRCFGLPETGSTRVKLSCGDTSFKSIAISGRGSFIFNEDFVFRLRSLDQPLRLELDGCNAGIAIIDFRAACTGRGEATLVHPLAKGQAGYVEVRLVLRTTGPLDSDVFSEGMAPADHEDELPDSWVAEVAKINSAGATRPLELSAAVGMYSSICYAMAYFGGWSLTIFVGLSVFTLRLALALWPNEGASRRSSPSPLRHATSAQPDRLGTSVLQDLSMGPTDESESSFRDDGLGVETNAAEGRVRGLPQWVVSPDAEKSFWFQKVLETLWPSICTSAEAELASLVQWALDQNRPSFLDTLKLQDVTLGDLCPVVTGVTQYPTAAKLVVDLMLNWGSNSHICISISRFGVGTTISMTDVCLKTTLRLIIDPLVPVLPCASAIDISMVVVPKVASALRSLGISPPPMYICCRNSTSLPCRSDTSSPSMG